MGRAERSERSIITSSVGSGSGGINTSALSRDTGGSGLGSRETTRVESTLRGSAAPARQSGSGQQAGRTDEEIQMVFDRNKGKLFSLYNRALRKDPTLEGKVVLKLTIDSGGNVTSIEILSSELNSPTLERKLLARVRMFDFGSRNVKSVVVTYPIDFFPG